MACIGSEVTFYPRHFLNGTFVLCHFFGGCEIYLRVHIFLVKEVFGEKG